MSKSRSLLIFGAAVAVLASAALPAYAEGSFTTSFSNASPGFNSRVWTDANRDSPGTSVSLRNCRTSNGANTFNLKLKRQVFGTDPTIGNVAPFYNCGGTTWQDYNWGRQTAGDYYFQIYKVGGNTTSSTGSADVKVYY